MDFRHFQNNIVDRAVGQAAQKLPVTLKTQQLAAHVAPVPVKVGADVLRCGVQNIGDAVLGK